MANGDMPMEGIRVEETQNGKEPENREPFWRRVKEFIVRAFELCTPYWKSPEHRKVAWTLLVALLAIEAAMISAVAKLSFAMADMMNVLDQRKFEEIWFAMGLWVFWATGFVALFLISIHVKYHLTIKWRQFMTERFLSTYVHKGLFHQLELKDYGLDNPDQRIAEDTLKVAQQSIEIGLSFLSTIGNAFVFGYILWTVGGAITLPIAGMEIVIPGYMFWVAILYSIIALWVIHALGHPLIRLNYERQAREADFRFKLIRLRENTEGIALLHGEESENRELRHRFGRIRDNWLELLKYQKRVLAVNLGFGQLGTVFPYVAAMPAFIAGTVALGGFLQLRQAFGSVQDALGFFVSRYASLAELKSNFDRLLVLERGIEAAKSDNESSKLAIGSSGGNTLIGKGLSLDLPDGQNLLQDVDFKLDPDSNVIITGESGSGKSTLFRALSNNWYWGAGEINRPEGKIMFLPQTPYLPIATLKTAMVYPNSPETIDDDRLKEIMAICKMEKFTDRLDERADWERILSGGEKQRLSIVRAMIEKPDWLFLDEATAALDPGTEAKIYEALAKELPETTLVSIAHRDSLKKYHQTELRLEPSKRSLTIGPVVAAP